MWQILYYGTYGNFNWLCVLWQKSNFDWWRIVCSWRIKTFSRQWFFLPIEKPGFNHTRWDDSSRKQSSAEAGATCKDQYMKVASTSMTPVISKCRGKSSISFHNLQDFCRCVEPSPEAMKLYSSFLYHAKTERISRHDLVRLTSTSRSTFQNSGHISSA